MLTTITALTPVFLLIVMGYALKRRGWVTDTFWAPAERITYYLFFPALLISAGMRANLSGEQVWPMALSLFCATFIVALAAIALKPVLGLKDAAFTSFFQGAIRPNTYVGVSVALLMYGDAGVALLSIAILAVVPMVNLIAVPVLVRWGDAHAEARTPQKAAPEIARNPLVLACLIGFGLNALGVGLPPVIGPLLNILGSAALPIALLAVGAGLDLPDLKANAVTAAQASALKLIALPALTWMLAAAQGVSGLPFQMAVLYACLSGSASSYVLAREMGGDAPLMAGIITATTLAAMVTMALWLVAAG
ncbi:MAG: AEC family transporter [Rhodospirillales bacterium]|nr:AEC family transporter [Rhodospirillales bacterium]